MCVFTTEDAEEEAGGMTDSKCYAAQVWPAGRPPDPPRALNEGSARRGRRALPSELVARQGAGSGIWGCLMT